MRSVNVKIAALVCVLGAIFAFITLGMKILDGGDINIAAGLYIVVIALLFFGMAGQFFDDGIVKGQAVALILAAITLVAIIAAYVLQDAFAIEWLFAMVICALIPAAIAASEADWFKYEKI